MHSLHRLALSLGIFICLSIALQQSVFAATFTDSLVGYWKFDQSVQGTTAVDSSGNVNNLTPFGTGGGPGITSDKPSQISFPDSYSTTYDGTQYEVAANNLHLNVTNLTMSVWVKFDTVNNTFQTIAGKWQIGVKQQYVLQLNSDNSIGLFTGNGSTGGGGLTTSTFTPDEGVWYNIIATVNGTTGTIYINGVQEASGTVTALGISDIEFTVGSKKESGGSYVEFLQGSIDDLRLYNRALTSPEIAALASGNHTSATWDGSSSTNYETAANWDINAIPDPFTNIIIPNVVNDPVMTAHGSVAGLTIQSAGVLDVAGYELMMRDSGTFTNSGTLRLQGGETLTGFTNDTSQGTIDYYGTGSFIGLNLGSNYYNVLFSGSGNYSLSNALSTVADVQLNGGTLNTNSNVVTVGGDLNISGGTFTLSFTDIDLNGDMNLSSGTLNVFAGRIDLAGDWNRTGGSFINGSSTVLLDGMNQTITGDNVFYNLRKITPSGTLTFPASGKQTTTGTLRLSGGSGGNYLTVRSSTPGVQFLIEPQGTRTILDISVEDSNNTDSTSIAFSVTNQYGSNLTNWITSGSSPTPTPTTTSEPTVNSGTSTSSSPPAPSFPTCSDTKPVGSPDLFQIDTTDVKATLYFSPVSDSVSEYMISYGYTSGDERFGITFPQQASTGVVSYTINGLSPNSTYYFKIRGGNGCMPGIWGNEMKITTKQSNAGGISYYKNFLSQVMSVLPRTVVNGGSNTVSKNSVTTSCSEYTVKAGDSLWNIASQQLGAGKEFTSIIRANNLQSNLLHPGQKLKLGC